jgi:hypothetical protein
VRVSICHCLECQRRTGSVFGTSARFARAQVSAVEGERRQFARRADSGNTVTFNFCPRCGTTVYWELQQFPDVMAVAVGAFADPGFPPPRSSVWEARRHRWAAMAPGLPIERMN